MYEIDSYRHLIITFISVFGIILFAYMLRYKYAKKRRKRIKFHSNLTAEMVFYSKLIDIELKKNGQIHKELMKGYKTYLYNKYGINDEIEKKIGLEKYLTASEQDVSIRKYLMKIYKDINSLKHGNREEVIEYVKELKRCFNKGDLKTWLLLISG